MKVIGKVTAVWDKGKAAVIETEGLVRDEQGPIVTTTATLFILRAFDEGNDAQGYIVATTLALVSVLLLSGIEILKHREERKLAP